MKTLAKHILPPELLKDPTPVEPPPTVPPVEPPPPVVPPAVPPPVVPPAVPPVEPPPPPPKKPAAVKPDVRADDFTTVTAPPPPVGLKPLAELLGYPPSENEAEYLETLRWAEEHSGRADLKGKFNQEIERLKRVKAFADKWSAENPDAKDGDFDPATAELKDGTTYRGTAGRAAVPAELRHRLELQRVRAQADDRVKEESNKIRAETDSRMRRMEMEPRINREAEDTERGLVDALALDDDADVDAELKKLARDKGLSALSDELPIEGAIVSEHAKRASSRVRALLAIQAGIEEFDADNMEHVELLEFVNTEAAYFATHGGADRVVNGRSFIEPTKFSSVKPEARDRYWTFSPAQIVDMLRHRAKLDAEAGLKRHRDGVAKRQTAKEKFKKPVVPPPAPIAPPPAGVVTPPAAPIDEPPPTSPRVRPAPAGHGGTPPEVKGSRIMQHLGLNRPQ